MYTLYTRLYTVYAAYTCVHTMYTRMYTVYTLNYITNNTQTSNLDHHVSLVALEGPALAGCDVRLESHVWRVRKTKQWYTHETGVRSSFVVGF